MDTEFQHKVTKKFWRWMVRSDQISRSVVSDSLQWWYHVNVLDATELHT